MPIIFFVYLLVFPNGKFYFGMSRTDKKGLYTNRYRNHALAARKGKDFPLYRAWRKHGSPELIIASEHPNREECAQAEIASIAFFDSNKPENGYNLMAGGEGLNAPKGSEMYALMMGKVWRNPERIAKLSASLKGRKPSEETLRAYQEWLQNGGLEIKAENARRQMAQPGVREAASERTRLQMTPEARAHSKHIHTGREDPRGPEGKERQRVAVKAYGSTPEGKAAARKGYEVFASKPEAVENNRAALKLWRSSEANRENNKRRAQLSAAKCSRRVEDIETGVIYPSQRAMARALGLSEAAISLRVKAGTVRRV